MATGRDELCSLSTGSEEVVEVRDPCSICMKHEKTVQGVSYCIECDMNYCSDCFDMHANFPANAGHHLIDIETAQCKGQDTEFNSNPGDVKGFNLKDTSEACCKGDNLDIDNGEFEMICSLSDFSKTEKPRKRTLASTWSPPMVQSLREARDIGKLKALQSNLTSVKDHLYIVKSAKQDQLKNVKSSEQTLLESVDELRSKLIAHINDLADEECSKIKAKYLPEQQAITSEIAEIDAHICVSINDGKALTEAIDGQGAWLQVNTNEIEKSTDASFERYNELWQSLAKSLPKYRLDTRLEHVLRQTHALGDFNVTAELQGELDVRFPHDTSVCDINGSCLHADGTLVFVDADNEKLKHINLENHDMKYCTIGGEPCAVCSIGYSDVAVTLTKKKKVQIVSLTGSTPTKTRSFSVEQCCRGICHYNGELFISCANNGDFDSAFVGVYTVSGTLLRKIEIDENGRRIFASPFHIAIDTTGSILVADSVKGVVSMDRFGRGVSVFNDRGLNSPFGICQMNNDSFLVGGLESHNIVQVRGSSRVVSSLLDKLSDIYCPLSVLYDCSKSLLIVTLQRSDSVRIYKIR